MTKPQTAGPLAATLDVVAEGCADLADPWWVFGSAGMALVGVPGLSPPDVDLIVSARDARTLLDRWNTAPLEAAGSSATYSPPTRPNTAPASRLLPDASTASFRLSTTR